MSKSRIEAFSDGVFAILITILVIEFHPVAGRPGTLLHQVTGQMPLLITYLTSYFYVGTLWLFHHGAEYFESHPVIHRNVNQLQHVTGCNGVTNLESC